MEGKPEKENATIEMEKNADGVWVEKANELIDSIPGFDDMTPAEQIKVVDETIMIELSADNSNYDLAKEVSIQVRARQLKAAIASTETELNRMGENVNTKA